jgi:hypothetical protein
MYNDLQQLLLSVTEKWLQLMMISLYKVKSPTTPSTGFFNSLAKSKEKSITIEVVVEQTNHHLHR